MTILLGFALAAFFAAFGALFLASAKAESWLALVVFVACALAVFILPVADWLRALAPGQDLIWVLAGGLIGGALCLWMMHRAGLISHLAKRMSSK